eukprot:64354_1
MGFTFYWRYTNNYVLTKEHFQHIISLIHTNNLVTEDNQKKYEFDYEETAVSFRLDDYETFSIRVGTQGSDSCKTARHKYSYIIKRILLIMKHVINDHLKISDDGWDEVEKDIDILHELKLDTTPTFLQKMNIKNIFFFLFAVLVCFLSMLFWTLFF